MMADRHSPFWGVTSYFNPVGYRRRRENYHLFRQAFALPLLTVELSHDGSFELQEGDADILLRYTAQDVIWQKERLLNLAIAQLPPDCEFVAWVDCDVLFGDKGWVGETMAKFEVADTIQLFAEVQHLPADAIDPHQVAPDRFGCERAVIANALHGTTPPFGATGFAWAARRSLLQRFGLFDACAIGGSDVAWPYAVLGDFQTGAGRIFMTGAMERAFRRWGEPLARSVAGRVQVLDRPIFHLWHGSLKNRLYTRRHKAMQALGYDPERDIRIAANGLWEWHQASAAMRAYVADYFRLRKEDGEESGDAET